MSWIADLFAGFAKPAVWSVPLIWAGATLADAAGGQCDSRWRAAARILSRHRPDQAIVYVRTGWEQNGTWMKWAARNHERQFNDAFRRFVAVFRSVSIRFRFIWCPNIDQQDPSPTFPGVDFVDLIGLDFYHFPKWDPIEPLASWTHMVTRPYGLQWHLDFARRQKKPVVYPEWGVCSDNFGAYIDLMAEWCRSSDIFFHSYWDSNAAYPGQLTSGQYAATAVAFRSAFGLHSR